MLFRINPNKILTEDVYRIVSILQNNGVIIYPTDSVYALGCSLQNPKAIERIMQMKKSEAKTNLSLICADMGQLADYTRPLPNHIFRIMKKAMPGPYTFILPASSSVPKLFLRESKKTVGIRVPDNAICREIVRLLGCPLVSTSLHNQQDDMMDYYTDPVNIYQHYNESVDAVVNGGYGNIYPTTVIDCTGDEPVVIRKGLGSLSVLD